MNTDIVISDIAALDTLAPADREVALTGILTQSRDWLVRATQATDPARAVADFKAFITTVAEAAKQKKVSEEIVTEATVMVRRTERALGVAIRDGQASGSITNASTAAAQRERMKTTSTYKTIVVPSPNTFAAPHELFGAKPGTGIYAVADNVTDAEFEEALLTAKEEGNVSRANVVRKLRGEPTPERTRKTNPIIERTLLSLSGYRMGLANVTNIDPNTSAEQTEAWIKEITETIRELSRVRNLLKEAI